MMTEMAGSSDDIFLRLQNIHGMFDSQKSLSDEKHQLIKQEKLDPSENLSQKLKLYEKCDGSVNTNQIEKLRKEYFEGLQFNTLQTALQLFKNSAENRQAKEAAVLLPIVSKGTIGDIRSVFIDAITSDNTIGNHPLTDEQWFCASDESRIRKLLTLSLPYLGSYPEMTNNLVLDSVRKVFSNVASDKDPLVEEISDRQWFYGMNENRVEQLINKAADNQISNEINGDMWNKIREALMHCVSSTAGLFNKHEKAESDLTVQQSGLTNSKIEKILAETTKEYKNKNKKVDFKIVQGITADLKKRIQTAITEQQNTNQIENPLPDKLTTDRINKIFSEYSKQAKKSYNIDKTQFEGLASSIKEKILQEMSKEHITKSVQNINVQPGITSSARQKLMDASEDTIKQQNQQARNSIDPQRLDVFTKLGTQQTRSTEWVPDIKLQSGIAQKRVQEFLQEPSKRTESEWTPDVPIISGLTKERVLLMTDPKVPDSSKAWVPEVPLEMGIAKDRAAQLLAAASNSNSTGGQWMPDVEVESGSVGLKTESFNKDVVWSNVEKDWKPDVELKPGFTKDRIKNLFMNNRSVDHSNEANEIISSGLTKERLSEFSNLSEHKSTKEWQPDIEMRKGLTKERTSLFHNLEALQQNTQNANLEQDKILISPKNDSLGQLEIEIENEPASQDPNIARGNLNTEQAQIQEGYTKLIMNKLKDAYDADEESKNVQRINTENLKQDLSVNDGHARNLRLKFTDFEQDAKTIHTTVEKQTHIPRRFVNKPAPTPIQCEIVTEEKCICCRSSVFSTEGIQIHDVGFVHKKCMRCPKCNKIPPLAEAVFQDNHMYCMEHQN